MILYYVGKYLIVFSGGIKKLKYVRSLKKRRGMKNLKEKKGCKILNTNPKAAVLNSMNKQVNPKYKIYYVRELQALWCTDGCT